MTKKKNIDNIRFLKKIVKKKERKDKEYHPKSDADLVVKELFSEVGLRL